jgi:hypothetical protein
MRGQDRQQSSMFSYLSPELESLQPEPADIEHELLSATVVVIEGKHAEIVGRRELTNEGRIGGCPP